MATSHHGGIPPHFSGKPLPESHGHSCARCHGVLIPESLFDLFNNCGQMRCWAYRCIQCGDVVDSLILKHRTGDEIPGAEPQYRRCGPKRQLQEETIYGTRH